MNTAPNTTSAVVADEASGAGASAPAPEVLTIDRNNLRLFLANYSDGVKAEKTLDELIDGDKLTWEEKTRICHAWTCVRECLRACVDIVHERGGLLLIGAEA